MLRIALIPVLSFLISNKFYGAALFFFLFLAWTDWLDGYIAKNYNQSTPIGKVFDPLADKVLIWVTLWTFQYSGLWFLGVLILFAIDMALLVFGAFAFAMYEEGSVGPTAIGANKFGKKKFFSQIVLVVTLFLGVLGAAHAYPDVYLLLLFTVLATPVCFATLSLIVHIQSYRSACIGVE